MAKKVVLLVLSLLFVLFVLFSCSQPAPKLSEDDLVIKFTVRVPEIGDSKLDPQVKAAYYEALKVRAFKVFFSQEISGNEKVRFIKDVEYFDRSGLTYKFDIRFKKSEAFELGKYKIDIYAYPEPVGIYKGLNDATIMSASMLYTFTQGGEQILPVTNLVLEKGNLVLRFKLDDGLVAKNYEIGGLKVTPTATVSVADSKKEATLVNWTDKEAGVYTFTVEGTIVSQPDVIDLKKLGGLKVSAMIYPAVTNIATVIFYQDGTYKFDLFFDQPKELTGVGIIKSAPAIWDNRVLFVGQSDNQYYLRSATFTKDGFGTVSSTTLTNASEVFTPIVVPTSQGTKVIVPYITNDGNGRLLASTSTTFTTSATEDKDLGTRKILKDVAHFGNDRIALTYYTTPSGNYSGYYIALYSATTLEEIKAKDIEGQPVTAPVVANNRIIIAVKLSSNNQYQIWDLDQDMNAVTTVMQKSIGDFAVDGDYVYFVYDNNRLYRKRIGAQTVEQIATIAGIVTTAPVVYNGKIYVGATLPGARSAIVEISGSATNIVMELQGNDVIKFEPVVDSQGYLYFGTSSDSNRNYVYLVDTSDRYVILRYQLSNNKVQFAPTLSNGAFIVPVEDRLLLFSHSKWIGNKFAASSWSKFRGDVRNTAKK